MIAGIRTSNGTIYKVKTRQGIACLYLEKEELQSDSDGEVKATQKHKEQLN